MRGGAVWQLVGLITRRSQVQILPPLPNKNGPLWGPFSFGGAGFVAHGAVWTSAWQPPTDRRDTCQQGYTTGLGRRATNCCGDLFDSVQILPPLPQNQKPGLVPGFCCPSIHHWILFSFPRATSVASASSCGAEPRAAAGRSPGLTASSCS